MSKALQRIARLLEPPPRYKISEWAEANAYLPSEGNAEPGKFRVARMPWQRAMLDDPLDPAVSEVVWMLASQLGKTMCIILIIEFFIDHQPTKILVVYPKLDDAKDWMRDKFIPATRDTPCLEGKLKEPRASGSESRALNRKFPGGGLVAVGSISTSSLRRVSARLVIQDEIDDFEVTPQGDSMALADMRAATFHNAVKLKSSTPTHKGSSRIESKFDQSDKQRFFVPCPACGHMQHLRWEQFKFSFAKEELDALTAHGESKRPVFRAGEGEFRDTSRAVYVCEKCNAGWSDQERIQAINDPRAQWQATAPFTGIRGRHLNGLYRLIGRKTAFKSYHHEFAEDHLKAKHGGRETLMVWINTFLAETFADATKQLEWHPLMERAEEYGPELPEPVVLLLAGIDVQDDRVEIGVFGWGDEEECWCIANHVVYGDFDRPEVQQQVDDYLQTRWKHPSGVLLDITATAIDSGHKTKAVYRFCKQRASRRVWAVKGSNQAHAPLITPSAKKHYGITLFSVGTDTAKDAIFSRLELVDAGPRCIHFPKSVITIEEDGRKREVRTGFDEKYYKQLCSEGIVDTFERGVYRRKYVKKQARNEALDKMVYGLAAYDILRPNIPRLRANTIGKVKPQPKEYVLKPPEETLNVKPETNIPPSLPRPQRAPRMRQPWIQTGKKWI